VAPEPTSPDPGDGGGQDPAAVPAEVDQRLKKLETGVETILGLLAGKKDGAAPAAPDAPSGVADEIARALDERDRKEAAARRESEDQAWRSGVDQKLSGLGEQTPDPPVRRVESFMKWR
jgi:hypothetical protein